MKRNRLCLTLALGCVAVLAGCSSVKKELGVGRQSPDEFTVVKRAPLSVPPDYALRAPSENNAPPPETAPRQQARAVLLGAAQDSPAAKNSADDALLAKMGATASDPDIRDRINRENGYLVLKNQTVAEKLIFWKKDAAGKALDDNVVDAAAERKRLEQNRTEGKPLNAGDVPVIQKKTSTIDKLF